MEAQHSIRWLPYGSIHSGPRVSSTSNSERGSEFTPAGGLRGSSGVRSAARSGTAGVRQTFECDNKWFSD